MRRAMAQGNVAALQAALQDHNASQDAPMPATPDAVPAVPEPPAPPAVAAPLTPPAAQSEAPTINHRPISVADALATLGDGLDDSRLAWIRGDVAEVRAWAQSAIPRLHGVLSQLDREENEEDSQLSLLPDAETDPGPVTLPPRSAEPGPEAPSPGPPTILLPKVRHPVALVVEGMGDAEQSPMLAEALGVDGVTARLIAVSRYPRFVLRGEDGVRLEQTAERVREMVGIRAVVVDRDGLLEIGPAVAVTQAVTATPLRVEVVDRAMWDVDLTVQAGSEPRELAPELRLAVVGEVVVHRFRAMAQGGRLKHIREHRVQGAGEERLGVVDLHIDDGILRVVEGATDLTCFPGHTPSAAVRSLRDFVSHLESMIPVMPRRICQPGLDRPGGGAVAGQSGPSQDTGWAAFEEHSRACRLLYGLPTPEQAVDGGQ